MQSSQNMILLSMHKCIFHKNTTIKIESITTDRYKCTLYISWINWIWQQNQDSKCTCAIHPTQDIYMTGIEYKIWKMQAGFNEAQFKEWWKNISIQIFS